MGTAVEERGGTRFYGVGYGMGRVCTVWHDAVPSGTATVKGHGGLCNLSLPRGRCVTLAPGIV